jgi:uncharacterized protein
MSKNVFGEALILCSEEPITGYFRTGCCETDNRDRGAHTVCAVMTADFLSFSLEMGNDLISPRPQLSFPGLKPGDQWCICVDRWMQAYNAGIAPPIKLEATNEETLKYIELEELVKFAYKAD